MWFRKSSPRRQAIREDVAEAESLVRAPRARVGAPVAMSLVFFLLATLIVYFPREAMPFRVGDRPPTALRARVAFEISDPAEYEREKQTARRHAAKVLLVNEQVLSAFAGEMTNLQVSLTSAASVRQLPPHVRELFPGLDDRGLRSMQVTWENNPNWFAVDVKLIQAALRDQVAIVEPPVLDIVKQRSAEGLDAVVLTSSAQFAADGLSRPLARRDVIVRGTQDAAEVARLRGVVSRAMPSLFVEPVTQALLKLDSPTAELNPALSEKYAEYRALLTKPPATKYKPDEVIVSAGEEITEAKLRALLAAQDAYEHNLMRTSPWAYLLSHVGEAIAVLVLTVAGALYVSRMNKQANTAGRGWALCGLLLLMLFIAKNATVLLPHATYMVGTAPTLLATIILIIVFNPRFALAVASIHGLLVTLALGQNFDFFLTLMTGIAVLSFGLSEIRTRFKLIEIGVFAAGGLLASVWALGLARLGASVWSPNWVTSGDLGMIGTNSLWAAGAGLLVMMIAQITLPLVETVFKITTAMKLIELCDANQPLLRRLAQEAPGTFNHSLTVGIMAEAAADAIGANGLLCRAGAYYHDVGKLSKPQYFIENQAGGPNRHEKLSPAMSLLIIVGHVKDGVELAREYGLPRVLHQFIAQHHGTTVVEYFFHAARKRQEAEGEDAVEIRDAEFRYPGPRPQSKETAILMICDGVESHVRSLPEQSPGKLETATHNMIMKRLMDGQFSECDLTLRELSKIEVAITRALAGIYHGRLAYPKPLSAESRAG